MPVVDALVQPLLEEAARYVGRGLAFFGIADPREIERQLKLVAPRSSLKEYYGEHLLGPGALVATLLATDRALVELGVVHGALWPVWSYVVVAALGFVAPDLVLQQRLKRRQRRIVAELPQALDLLGIAVLAGQSLQQALVEVAPLALGTNQRRAHSGSARAAAWPHHGSRGARRPRHAAIRSPSSPR